MPKIAGAPVRPKKPVLQGPAIADESIEPKALPWLNPALVEKIQFHHGRNMSREKLAFIYGKATVQAVLGSQP